MLISYNWLKKFVNLSSSITVEEVAARLKATTVEVEGIKKQGELLNNVVVGKVVSAIKHPNADKLKLCRVDVGPEELQIVCGGSNVVEGMLAAIGKVGAKVQWHGEGELIELSPTKIRGEESFGMICASDEIGLREMFPAKEEKEILDLSSLADKKNIVGLPLAEVLGLNDTILEIDNKSLSNRPDLWGHYGIAREVAVLFNRDLKKYEVVKIKPGKDFKLKVEIEDTKLCPRYMAVAVSGIKVGPSPQWLQEKLLAVGSNPINNIVDITNYIMLELGQPLHAFDASKVGHDIGVRLAKEGEKFVALDEAEYTLSVTDLMIVAGNKSLGIAGVKGGLESGTYADTTTVIFESANFNAASVRKTATRLGLRTDSAIRYEKSLDPNLCEIALQKAVELALEICPGAKVVSKVVDEKKFHLSVGPLELSNDIFVKKLGVDIEQKDILNILSRLGFEVKTKKNSLLVTIPTWRATKDISIAEDVVEEVARFFGYENIPSALPNFPINPPEKNVLRDLERDVSEILVKTLGYNEVYNYSFVSDAQVNKMGDDLVQYLELDNPLSKERPFLRRNLLPNLLENIKNNIENYSEVKIFEIGKVFSTKQNGLRLDSNGDDLLPKQDTWVATMYAGKKEVTPFWQARRALENIFVALKTDFQIVAADMVKPWEHPTRLALVMVGGEMVGVVCEINPIVAQSLGVEQRVGVLQLNLSLLVEILSRQEKQTSYRAASVYPEVMRDLAFLVKKEFTHGQILKALEKTNALLKNVELFDVYEGSKISEGYKSMAYRLTFGHHDRTLTADEIENAMKKAQEELKKEFNAEVR
ncbi:MAG: phenylalanine--tRNA ligase subunit beta [Candidatus Magasanikbacteria bacterium]|nr:phenylalanine--tRNA ligase subunit beta [Candidatus Magasanikbacteria bacterium]